MAFDEGLANYCIRQARDGTAKQRRLAEASVCLLKLTKILPAVGDINIEEAIGQLNPEYLEKIRSSSMLPPKTVTFITSSTKARMNQENLLMKQEKLLELSTVSALALLQSGKHAHAMLAAQQFLVLAGDIYGVNDLRLIPAYALLAEICIGLNKHREADQHLQKANWVVKRNQEDKTINHVFSRLYRAMGLLEAAKGNTEDASRLFAEQVFYASQWAGTESIGAASGYYNLANMAAREPGLMQVASSFYLRTLDCWLLLLKDEKLQVPLLEKGETFNMLTSILETLESLSPESAGTAKALTTLAWFSERVGEPHEELKSRASELIQRLKLSDSNLLCYVS